MIYEIILNNGKVLKCWTDDVYGVLRMMARPDDIFIVKENEYPYMVSYIMPDKVSYFRFPKGYDSVAEPV